VVGRRLGLDVGTRRSAVAGISDAGRRAWELPYRLHYEFECCSVDPPHRIDSILHGDFEGSASLVFEPAEDGTRVILDFRPRVNKAGVRQLTPLLRPIFRSNHAWAMRRGQKRIGERLQA
jgi:hypothetical protein